MQRLLAVLSAAALLAACASGADDAMVPADEPDSDATTGGSNEAGASGDDGTGDETRAVTHEFGESEIPTEPQRIVALWGPTLSVLLALGEEPVAAVDQGYVDGVDVPSGYDLDRLTLTGESREPDLELIASVEPDLIIGAENFAGDVYDELSQLAPTVLLEWEGSGAWADHLDEVAEVLDLGAARDDVVADYDRRVAGVREAIGDVTATEVSIVRFQGDELRLEGRASSAGVVVEDLGLPRPEPQDFADEGFRPVSLERLPDADGDVLFLWGNDEDGDALLEEARANPLWDNLEAVRNDAVHTVDGDVWQGASYFAAHQVLDEIEATLGSS